MNLGITEIILIPIALVIGLIPVVGGILGFISYFKIRSIERQLAEYSRNPPRA